MLALICIVQPGSQGDKKYKKRETTRIESSPLGLARPHTLLFFVYQIKLWTVTKL